MRLPVLKNKGDIAKTNADVPEEKKNSGKKSKKSGTVKERNRIASLDKKKARAGWIFVLPFVIGFILIYLPILFDSVKYSFSKLNLIQGGGLIPQNVMFDNYKAVLDNAEFTEKLLDGLKQLALYIPAILFFSLFIAIILNQKMVGRAAFRAIFFIPVILVTGLVTNIDQTINSTATADSSISTGTATESTSIVNEDDIRGLFENMIVGKEIVQVVTGFVSDIFNIVNRSGVQMLIFLAGLQGISPAVYESCEMEGASPWETFWKITLPMISPMILVNFVYTLIDSFTSDTNIVMQYIDKFSKGSTEVMVQGSAMSWLYFAIVIGIVAIVVAILGRLVFYQRRD